MNKQKILIAISSCILLVLLAVMIISFLNKKATPIRDILSITWPVTGIQGVVESIEGSVLTVSYPNRETLMQPTPATKNIRLLMTKDTNISYGTGYYELPSIPGPEQTEPLKNTALKKGQTVSVLTDSDLRVIQKEIPKITYVRILSVSRHLVGTITARVNKNTYRLRGRPMLEPMLLAEPVSKEEDYLITILPRTEIMDVSSRLPPESPLTGNSSATNSAQPQSPDNLAIGTFMEVYTAEDILETKKGDALSVMIQPPLPKEPPQIVPTVADMPPLPE